METPLVSLQFQYGQNFVDKEEKEEDDILLTEHLSGYSKIPYTMKRRIKWSKKARQKSTHSINHTLNAVLKKWVIFEHGQVGAVSDVFEEFQTESSVIPGPVLGPEWYGHEFGIRGAEEGKEYGKEAGLWGRMVLGYGGLH